MNKITTLELNTNEVIVREQNIIIIEDKTFPVGEVKTTSYQNSIRGRKEIVINLDEKYVNAIFAVWGDAPTIIEDAQ